ncbi:DNA circularization protein [Yersinia enterocolitica]|uniref:DNA circularization protein n=1 Tax=Yersinia enterocolitica TaxID=630 RepID=UPI0037CFD2D1
MGWAENLQNASFRGITFDVINTDEQISRDHAAYEYPYVDGADLKDLGRKARPFRMTAFLWGDNYEYRLQRLTAALDEPGDGELIHPIYGSIPSVIVTSYSIRHEAESPDSCTLELNFLENRTGSALFNTPLPEMYSNALFDELEQLNERLSAFFDAIIAPLNHVNSLIKRGQTVRSTLINTLLTFKSDVTFSAKQMLALAEEPGKFIGALGDVLEIHTSNMARAIPALSLSSPTITMGLNKTPADVATSPTVMANWHEIVAEMDKLISLPVAFINGDQTPEVPLPLDATVDDVQDINVTYTVLAVSELASAATALLSDDKQPEELTPADIGKLVGDVRQRLQDAITLLRTCYEPERGALTETASPLGLMYPELVQRLKNVGAAIQEMGLLILSRRPPLTQKTVKADTCFRLLAHLWYADHNRAAELQRLNPHVQEPNRITAGMVLNAYAK